MPQTRISTDSACLAERYQSFCQAHPAQFIVAGGHRWPYRIGGPTNAPAIILLPGALGRPETSFEYFTAFDTQFRVLSPGYPDSLSRMSDLADGCVALLDANGINRAHVVGGSFGGLVAQAMLDRHPERMGYLVLSDTSPPVRARAFRMQLCVELIQLLPPKLVRSVLRFGVGRYVAALPSASRRFWQEHFREMLLRLSKNEIRNRARAWTEFDQTNYAPDISRPVLVLCAESDSAVSPRAFLRRFPQATVQRISSPLGHAASVGDAAAYIAPMRVFLNQGEL